MNRRGRKGGLIRRLFRLIFLGLIGIVIGVLCYEAIMLARVSRLRTLNPTTTSLIETRVSEAQERGEKAKVLHRWVSIDQISPNLQRAVIAAEDSNFFTHQGFDYEAIQKAWDDAMREAGNDAKRSGESNSEWIPSIPTFKRGASTISQQLAKNLYLSSDRTLVRKGQEAILTVYLERLLTKRRILEIYLNMIEWGDGVYGAEVAAQYHLRKSASSLTTSEAAFLAAIIPNPRTVYNPQTNPKRVAKRQRIIMRGIPHVNLQSKK